MNIALVEDQKPVAGWVYVPVKEQLYYGWVTPEPEAFKEAAAGIEQIFSRKLEPTNLAVVASRRHGGEALQEMLERAKGVFENIDLKNFGSSLKICMIAEGRADWCPRLAPTSEWDTAAAHAVLLGAGGLIVDSTLQDLEYNRKDSMLNPHFHAFGEANSLWQKLVNQS